MTACGGGSASNEPVPTSKAVGSGLASFDTCAFLGEEELSAAGVSGPGKPETQLSFEPGCAYEGADRFVTLYKNQEQTVDSYRTGGNWTKYEPVTVAGRNAARAIEAGGQEDLGCTVLVDAGGGVVLYDVQGIMAGKVADPCAEAEKIANQTASRLPK
ncbi:DUF3558 domain-containing protein [Saccharopolyspora erythraea]|nr:DUF3558 domain-containing protein [Saccharopolyspora erythraea]